METIQFPKLEMEKRRRLPWKFLFVIIVGIVVAIVAIASSSRPPSDFVSGTTVTIPWGASTKEAAMLLEDAHVIKSKGLFQFAVKVVLGNRSVIAGEFQFDKPQGVFKVAETITGGLFGKAQLKITIPEGSSTEDIADIMMKQNPSFDRSAFMAQAKTREGFLFPETYFVFKTITPAQMIERLNAEYEKKVAPLRADMTSFGKSETEIITMASILEKEARNAEEAAIISGILWKRIKLGMPLQVDAPFLYVLDKTGDELSRADLQKDGPYNTYTRKGLPAGPIGNPGIAMIMAAMHPVESAYLYYLHDKKGVIHYAKTNMQQSANAKLFLGR